MNIHFKKIGIFAVMTSILTPQMSFATCSQTACLNSVTTYIESLVDQELATNPIDPMITNIVTKKLKNFLTKYYKPECFMNQIDTITGTIVAGKIPSAIGEMAAGINEAQAKLAGYNLNPITIQLIINTFPHLLLDKFTAATKKLEGTKGDEDKRLIEKITKDPEQRKKIIGVCENIIKTLSDYFDTTLDSCWGNATDKKLSFRSK